MVTKGEINTDDPLTITVHIDGMEADDNGEELLEENLNAWNAFTALSTQWKRETIASMSGVFTVYQGIDYGAIEPVLRLLNIEDTEVFGKIRIMEAAALGVLNER